MRLSILVILVLTCFLSSACTSFRPHSDYDPEVAFNQYATFAFSKPYSFEPSIQDPEYISPFVRQRIERSIVRELVAKGFRQVEDETAADFLVSFTVGSREKYVVDSYPIGYHRAWIGHWPYYHGHSVVDVHTYTEGMLAIDIFDRDSGRPAWHGVVRKRITERQIDDRKKQVVEKAVASVMKAFPPNR